jgi:hypothetical protein
MSREPSSDRKRKAVQQPEVSIYSDERTPKKSKFPRGSLDSMTLSQIASLYGTTPMSTEKVTAVITVSAVAKHEDSIECIGALVQDLFPFGSAKVSATLDALNLDLLGNKKKCDKIHAVGGCLALVQALKNCLDKAMKKIPQCDQVTKINGLSGLTDSPK